MKLLPNCIRDVMLYLENNLDYDDTIFILESHLPYTDDELVYTCKKLNEQDLIDGKKNILGDFMIQDITYKGHLFISKLKDDTIWKKALSKINNLKEPLTIAILENLLTSITIVK